VKWRAVSWRSRACREFHIKPLAELCPDEGKHVVRVRVTAEHRLREREGAVDVDVEDPVRAGDDLDDRAVVLVLLEQSRRQTGGVVPRPSGDAVLDPDAVRLGHRSILTLGGQPAARSRRPLVMLDVAQREPGGEILELRLHGLRQRAGESHVRVDRLDP
jgi:hypothetical protein